MDHILETFFSKYFQLTVLKLLNEINTLFGNNLLYFNNMTYKLLYLL